tara:strand:- start:21200 stop:21364 length:165 start_codon:yes stop_codon:yes gene_type:complete
MNGLQSNATVPLKARNHYFFLKLPNMEFQENHLRIKPVGLYSPTGLNGGYANIL